MISMCKRKWVKRRVFLVLFLPLLFVFQQQAACENHDETIYLSMLPGYSPDEILDRIAPLAKYLSSTLSLEPYLMSNNNQYLRELKSGYIGVGFQNPYIYALASKNHKVIASVIKGDAGDKSRGVIISRTGGTIHSADDLRGKKVCYVGLNSASGFLSQKLTLLRLGIDVMKDLQLVEAIENKHENVVFAVYSGDVDAGFVQESALDNIQKFIPINAITVVGRTEWLPNWVVSVKRSMPEAVKLALQNKLVQLKKGHPVLVALKIDGFRPADDSEFNFFRSTANID